MLAGKEQMVRDDKDCRREVESTGAERRELAAAVLLSEAAKESRQGRWD